MFHLGWFLGNGFSVQGWPAPGHGRGYDWTKPELYQDMTRLLERGGFDMLVIEDTSMVPDTYQGSSKVYLAHAHHAPKHDPVPLVPLIAAATRHIGIVPTLTTTYYPPYLLARLIATLDHLTDGRVGMEHRDGDQLALGAELRQGSAATSRHAVRHGRRVRRSL